MYALALTLHLLAAVIWVGGMFFAYMLLRPVLDGVQAEQRLTLWAATLKKFFPWVWLCIVVLLGTGFWMIAILGGFSAAGGHIYAMMVIGIIMVVIFKFVYAAPFRHLLRGVEEQKWQVAAFALGTIRKLVAANLALGMLVVGIAVGLKGYI